MKMKWTAIVTVIVMMAAMMPMGVFAASGTLEFDDVRLVKEIETDQNGNIVYAGYYNQDELLVYAENISKDNPEDSRQVYSTYNADGNLIEEEEVWHDGTRTKYTYEYDEEQQMTSIKCWTADGELSWSDDYTYDQRGNEIGNVYQSAEGHVYTRVSEYDDSGREITSTETEQENPDSETTVWKKIRTYQEFGELSWAVTTTVYDSSDHEEFSYTESYEYNKDGGLISSVDFDEGELYRTTCTYDEHGRMIRSEQTMESDPGFPPVVSTYQYRPNDRIDRESYRSEGNEYTTVYYYTLKQFDDVADTEYFAYPVKWAVDQSITAGISDTEFGPYENCTRAQAVTFLWRAAGQPEPAASVSPFQDVTESDYYYKAVLWAVEKGITNGISPELFGSDQTCNRGQIVTFLYRFREEPGLGGTVAFSDVTEQDYFYGAVLWAVADGVTNGTSETTFSPGANCTRGQIVTFLYRAMAAA